MRTLSKFFYVNIAKPIFFLFPADYVHEFFLIFGRYIGKVKLFKILIKKFWSYEDKILRQKIVGLNFKNPIGLSAGFDYNADLVEILPSVGFGFHSIGTLTHEAYGGNQRPMLGRLPKSQSLLVNKGFKNKGINNVLKNFKTKIHESPIGVSIGATNKPYNDFESMLENLVAGFKDAENFKNFDYYELNISCPNLSNIQNLKEQIASPSGLRKALILLEKLNLTRPVFIKMPLERTEDEIKELISVAKDFNFINGLIFSNLAKDRKNKIFDQEEIKNAPSGNFSGKPVEKKSNELIRYAYKNFGDRFIIIGVGGVFTGKDAYKKILLGASLVQLITGMIFLGPEQIGIINKELTELLKKDGYKNIGDAVGIEA